MFKLKKYIPIILVLLFTCFGAVTNAQISVLFNPAVQGASIEGIAAAQVMNASASDCSVALTIKVKEQNGLDVVSIKLPNFAITRGLNQINRAAYSNARFSFATSNTGFTLKQSGKFPEGEYEYCFEIEVSNAKDNSVADFYENCFNYNLQPLTPLLLISPVDEDVTCNKRPYFIWQPPLPMPPNSSCRLILVEVKQEQDVAEALAFNLPIVNQANLKANTLSYLSSLADLKEGHQYAWQVTAYNGQTILKKSEIWTFTIQCNEKQPDVESISYRELKETDDGNFYIARQYLKFSLNNPYNQMVLDYTIECLSDPSTTVKGLPTFKVVPGLNKYDLDLSENHSFKAGKEYLLKVRLLNNRQLSLRFIYKNE